MRIAAFAVLFLGAAALILYPFLNRPPAPDLPDRLVYEVVSFDDLPGWETTDLSPAFDAFHRSCEYVRNRHSDASSDDLDAHDWLSACAAADSAVVAAMSMGQISGNFFEGGFTPIRILNNSETEGMFTGYYEPELQGSPVPTVDFPTPLHARPDDLVMVQLRDFPGDHSGRIAGRVVGGSLRPFEDRTEIEEGALGDLDVLAYVNPVDAFFLQIQGSGRVVFEDGTVTRVGYAGTNGHPYTAIGRTLINMGELTLENVSMQSIRDWLHANPVGAVEVMRSNASYVFFREIDVEDPALGPIGSAGVPLTPGYSLAVDRTYHAMGAPVYVNVELADGTPFQRLMVAQDTGGAIRGPIRGDIFFGYGDEAAELAGPMRGMGEMWVLVPNAVATRIMAEQAAVDQ